MSPKHLESQRSGQHDGAMTFTPSSDWPTVDPDVRLVFEGLLWFLFHANDECEVAIHNTTHDLFHIHQHDLVLKIWTNCTESPTNPEVIPIGNPKDIVGIQLDVNKPNRNYEGVHVFQNPKDPNDEKNWSWVIDFEKEPLYPTGIKLHADKINPGISINHGYFYTLYRTTKDFQLRPTENRQCRPDDEPCSDPRKVALLVGGNIYLENDGDVTLAIRFAYPKPPIIKKFRKGELHQLDIRNVCFKGGKRCDPQVHGPNGNDFFLYNETFTQPIDRPKYILFRIDPKRSIEPAPLPKDICFQQEDKPTFKSSNELPSSNDAPCGPVGAGKGGGG
jgi:hypothetical protein